MNIATAIIFIKQSQQDRWLDELYWLSVPLSINISGIFNQ